MLRQRMEWTHKIEDYVRKLVREQQDDVNKSVQRVMVAGIGVDWMLRCMIPFALIAVLAGFSFEGYLLSLALIWVIITGGCMLRHGVIEVGVWYIRRRMSKTDFGLGEHANGHILRGDCPMEALVCAANMSPAAVEAKTGFSEERVYSLYMGEQPDDGEMGIIAAVFSVPQENLEIAYDHYRRLVDAGEVEDRSNVGSQMMHVMGMLKGVKEGHSMFPDPDEPSEPTKH